jgi:hypothetical protein
LLLHTEGDAKSGIYRRGGDGCTQPGIISWKHGARRAATGYRRHCLHVLDRSRASQSLPVARDRKQGRMAARVYVGNVPASFTREELTRLFDKYGRIARLVRAMYTNLVKAIARPCHVRLS